jgi:dienelactone hydrolase
MYKVAGMLAAMVVAAHGEPTRAQVPGMPQPVITDPGPQGVRVDEAGVYGNFFAPAVGGRHPGILLIGGSEGGLGTGVTRQAKALQADGFAVLNVAYFGWPNGPKALASVPIETFTRAVAWLQAQPGVDRERIGVVGASKGAEAALIVAAADPAIKAVVAGMPSSVAWPGISYTGKMEPSWTIGGKPMPFLPYAFGSDYRNIFGAYDNGLKALGEHPDAVIEVERIKGPVMLICGKADSLWPSCPMSEQIVARLNAKGTKQKVQLLEYADAGHALFGPPVDPSNPAFPTLGSLGGSPEGNNTARRDDWPRALAFLHQALGS